MLWETLSTASFADDPGIGALIARLVSGGPTLLGLPVFGLVGFLGAVAGSLWLVYSIWRSGGGR